MGVSDTGLWKRSLGVVGTHGDAITRLMGSHSRVRERVALLTTRIAAALPDLTIHDVTHLDALWEVADVIAGDDYTLSPLEAYVFGCAVLLHDSALCFEAYTDGKDGVRRTSEWRDVHARLTQSGLGVASTTADEADFETLRALHARQAEKLAIRPWKCDGDSDVYLIEDSDLRENYGRLIGQIAASHHWPLGLVQDRLSAVHPAPSFFPQGWTVDGLKVACLLRCADAGHIDSARAPSFLLKILRMNALSRTHWVAQNHLGRAFVDVSDPTRLVVASTRPFGEDDAQAWWVAFDAVELLDRELRGCNEILRDRGPHGRQFACKSVAGAGNVRALRRYVSTEGWQPTDTKVHVSDVAALVQRLGGEQLYGGKDTDKVGIVLRELVQNASDAVRARRVVGGGEFEGKVVVRLTKGGLPGTRVLQVDDNGVGMSPSTLMHELMDFGKSFWPSARAATEFPGIHSSGYRPVGQFGIGFFSIFMLARTVRVISRRFDTGIDAVRCLCFARGLSLRPSLNQERPQDFGMDWSTRVELVIPEASIVDPERITIRVPLSGASDLQVSFSDYVGACVAGIDVPIFVEWRGVRERVHAGFPPRAVDRRGWLEKVAYSRAGANPGAKGIIDQHVQRLREVRAGSTCYGLAALNTAVGRGCHSVTAKAVGGLVAAHGRMDESFVGLINHDPVNARRDAGEIAAPTDAMDAWLDEQVQIIRDDAPDPLQRLAASGSLCALGRDPIEVLSHILVQGDAGTQLMDLAGLANFLRSGGRLGFRISSFGSHIERYGELVGIPGVYTYVAFDHGRFNETDLVENVPKYANSLIGTIQRRLVQQGCETSWHTTKGAYKGPFGRCDLLEVKARLRDGAMS